MGTLKTVLYWAVIALVILGVIAIFWIVYTTLHIPIPDWAWKIIVVVAVVALGVAAAKFLINRIPNSPP